MGKVKESAPVKESVEVKKEIMQYKLTMPDGTVIEGSTGLRKYTPNEAKKVQNSGFQVRISDGDYSGNIMIIDALKAVRL